VCGSISVLLRLPPLICEGARQGSKQETEMRAIWVHCYHVGSLMKSSDFGLGETPDDTAVQLPTGESLEAQAKSNLTTERLAFPPHEGISFSIEFPH
jgi:hypothetical protein